jgi:predicted transcriptional regulator
MRQFSVRLSDDHAAAVKRLAQARGRSVNQTFEDLVVAATDPANASDAMSTLRERMLRAGLIYDVPVGVGVGPDASALELARAAAGRGTPLSQIVSEQRG